MINNIEILHSKMVLKGDYNFNEDLYRLLDITRQALTNKKAGRSNFTQEEIKKIVDYYELTPIETYKVFFTEKAEDIEQRKMSMNEYYKELQEDINELNARLVKAKSELKTIYTEEDYKLFEQENELEKGLKHIQLYD